MWEHFTLSEDGKKCVCTICKVKLVFSGGSTSSMLNHLKIHKSLVDSEKPTPRQTTLAEFHRSKASLPPKKYEKICSSIAYMCAVDLRPLSIVHGIGFQKFAHELNPDFKVNK